MRDSRCHSPVPNYPLCSGLVSRTRRRPAVSSLKAGESRPVTLGTMVDFTVQGANGQVQLPGTQVSSRQLLALAPVLRTAQPGEMASYPVRVENPTGAGYRAGRGDGAFGSPR